MTNMPLRNMITFAYDVRDFQVSGGPGWVGTERFEVTARPERAAASGPWDPAKITDEQLKSIQEQMRERPRAKYDFVLEWTPDMGVDGVAASPEEKVQAAGASACWISRTQIHDSQ